jgi:hypothetical protein
MEQISLANVYLTYVKRNGIGKQDKRDELMWNAYTYKYISQTRSLLLVHLVIHDVQFLQKFAISELVALTL